jgi:hypothetical protein
VHISDQQGGEERRTVEAVEKRCGRRALIYSRAEDRGHEAAEGVATSLTNLLLASTFSFSPTTHTLVYKKVGQKINAVPTTMPEYAKIR